MNVSPLLHSFGAKFIPLEGKASLESWSGEGDETEAGLEWEPAALENSSTGKAVPPQAPRMEHVLT